MEERYQGITVLDGRGKLVMPGLTDGHTHVCQQLLRGRISDEFPMIWTRFLVPFESSLTEEDVAASARLACLQMISQEQHPLRMPAVPIWNRWLRWCWNPE